jgi:hypothetical protein
VPQVEVLGFATTLGNGKRVPVVQAGNRGTIEQCLDRTSLAAVFTVNNLPAGAVYRQLWLRNGQIIFRGKITKLRFAITAPRVVYLAFRKNAALPNGRYSFRLVVNGRPTGSGGAVTRRC